MQYDALSAALFYKDIMQCKYNMGVEFPRTTHPPTRDVDKVGPFGGLPFIGRGQARGRKSFRGGFTTSGGNFFKNMTHQCSRALYSSPRGCEKPWRPNLGTEGWQKSLSKNSAPCFFKKIFFADLREKTFVPSGPLAPRAIFLAQ